MKNTENQDGTQQTMVVVTQGGAGDVLAATPMLRYWKDKYPRDKLVVLATYAQLLDGIEYIDKVVSLNDMGGVYEEYCLDMDPLRFFKKHFVYDSFFDDRFTSKTLPEFICKVYGAEFDGNAPDYKCTKSELRIAEYFLSQFTKPVILVHAFGSIPSDSPNPQKVHMHKDMDLEPLSKLIEKYKDKFDFVQIGLIGEPEIVGCRDGLGMPLREAVAVLKLCSTAILIESIFAHCAAALEKTAVVVFNNTNPEFFGYPNNININSNCDCKQWPCNRPLGALFDFEYGYVNSRTRARPLWVCKDQVCKKIPFELFESAFLRAAKKSEIQEQTQPAQTLGEARKR